MQSLAPDRAEPAVSSLIDRGDSLAGRSDGFEILDAIDQPPNDGLPYISGLYVRVSVASAAAPTSHLAAAADDSVSVNSDDIEVSNNLGMAAGKPCFLCCSTAHTELILGVMSSGPPQGLLAEDVQLEELVGPDKAAPRPAHGQRSSEVGPACQSIIGQILLIHSTSSLTAHAQPSQGEKG
eukprot:scaffold7154_cov33-Prasinocladus_malaysianus.AAC.1